MSFADLFSYLDSNWLSHFMETSFSALEVAFQIAILRPDAEFLFGVARKVDVKLHSLAPGAQAAGNSFHGDSSSESVEVGTAQGGGVAGLMSIHRERPHLAD